MIRVQLAAEPPTFDVSVRQRGLDAIRELDDMLVAYKRLCAYTCLYIEHVTGGATVDHMIPKSTHWDHVYEWSNYRLACGLMNGRKNDARDVLDPFEIDGTGAMDATLIPLSAADGSPAGDPWVVTGAPLSADGRFALAFGPQLLPAAANPVFPVDSLVDLTFEGFTVSTSEICGTMNGGVVEPVPIDVTGSPWGTAPFTPGAPLPIARTTCP
jgi:hypothetical protein